MFSFQEIEALIQQAFLNGIQDCGNLSADYRRSVASFEFHCLLKARNIKCDPQRDYIISCEKIESLIENAYNEGLVMGKINRLSDFRNSKAYQEFVSLSQPVAA